MFLLNCGHFTSLQNELRICWHLPDRHLSQEEEDGRVLVPRSGTTCCSERPNHLLASHPQRLYGLPDVTLSLNVLPAEQPQAEPEKRCPVELKGWWRGAAPTMKIPRCSSEPGLLGSSQCHALLSRDRATMHLQVLQFSASKEGQIHPIISHQTQTLLHMPARFC